ncbi:hypothetical protein M427DRAFT_57629 [Gonapodya prolifera JEL478]|uniref:Tafazzin family protein n=1 Tax=Gonapodya prolifera (strain JEL478) TaxID=1344416 RepID=A0A139ACB8_GONPJ|nr:hypothetical protein M427DRAFT_57629 [Gonapodya prolifera JEL478]|eukprot:KXS14451.1 hypothetical protein M427DRAFT_57629 [Gonapodya prolifera JEL478]
MAPITSAWTRPALSTGSHQSLGSSPAMIPSSIPNLTGSTTGSRNLDGPLPFSLVSSFLMFAVMGVTKAWAFNPFLTRSFCVKGNREFTELVRQLSKSNRQSYARNEGMRPLITYSNHVATVDDPITWSTLPISLIANNRTSRWVPSTREIVFNTPLKSWFFGNGQSICIDRGGGIWQEGMNASIEKLKRGGWIHIFPEGKINQHTKIARFKWGISRLLHEVLHLNPTIVPIYVRGMEQVVPLDPVTRNTYSPVRDRDLLVAFGNPVDGAEVVRLSGTDRRVDHSTAGLKENERDSSLTKTVSDEVSHLDSFGLPMYSPLDVSSPPDEGSPHHHPSDSLRSRIQRSLTTDTLRTKLVELQRNAESWWEEELKKRGKWQRKGVLDVTKFRVD